jgi:hypothetical protein
MFVSPGQRQGLLNGCESPDFDAHGHAPGSLGGPKLYLCRKFSAGTGVISPGLGVNRLRVEQDGPYIAVQINGHYVDMTPSSTVGSDYYVFDSSYNSYPPLGHHFGVISVASPSSSVTTFHDDYRVVGWQTMGMTRPSGDEPLVALPMDSLPPQLLK